MFVECSRQIAASPAQVYQAVADYGPARSRWLPANYSNLVLVSGSSGAGTRARFHLKVGPRERDYDMLIEEPAVGSMLKEKDQSSSMVFTWRVEARDNGSSVTLSSQWNGGGGIRGIFERLFAPIGLRRTLTAVLAGLDQYVRGEDKAPH